MVMPPCVTWKPPQRKLLGVLTLHCQFYSPPCDLLSTLAIFLPANGNQECAHDNNLSHPDLAMGKQRGKANHQFLSRSRIEFLTNQVEF